jgi:hypothetical protein
MQLLALQEFLENVYEVASGYLVDDFLITDMDVARQLDTRHPSAARERLLVRAGEEHVDMSLYLDAGVLNRLTAGSAGAASFDDLCLALEGVSHFTYLCWNASHGRAVTLLELELQAEVDKYVWLRHQSRDDRGDGLLRHHLFECFRLDESLDPQEQERYLAANYYAGKYCMGLSARYARRRCRHLLHNELRRFYRQTQGGKIRMIDALH